MCYGLLSKHHFTVTEKREEKNTRSKSQMNLPEIHKSFPIGNSQIVLRGHEIYLSIQSNFHKFMRSPEGTNAVTAHTTNFHNMFYLHRLCHINHGFEFLRNACAKYQFRFICFSNLFNSSICYYIVLKTFTKFHSG